MLKPYPHYKDSEDTWIKNVPNGWIIIRNKYFLQEINIPSLSGDEELLTVSQFTGITRRRDRLKDDSDLLTTAKSLQGYKTVDKETMVMNIMLAWNGSLGVSDYDGIVSPAYSVFRINKNFVFPKYLHYLHRTKLYTGIFETASTGVIKSRLRLYPEKYLSLKSILPSVTEQIQIARYLDWKTSLINKFIKAKKRLIELSEEELNIYLYGRNNKVFSKKTENWEGNFPNSWLMVKAKRIFDELTIKNESDKMLLAVTQDRGILPKILCEQKYLSPSDKLEALKLVRVNDFVISLRSFQGGIEHSKYEGIVSPAYNVFSLNDRYNCVEYIRFYKYLFKTKPFISLLNTIISGIRDGKNINFADFSEVLIPAPPKEDIKLFSKSFDRLEFYKDMYIREKKLLEEYRDRLVFDAVTGKVDVRDIKIPEFEEETAPEEPEEDIAEEPALTDELNSET